MCTYNTHAHTHIGTEMSSTYQIPINCTLTDRYKLLDCLKGV